MGNKGLKKVLSIVLAVSCIAFNPQINTQQVKATETGAVPSQEYNWKNVQIYAGGYVDNIVFNPGEQDLIYARTDMGGAYRWNPADSSWIPLTDWIGADNWNNLGCESLAVDSIETNRVYIAAGTYTNEWTSANGYIMRSEDKGDTWQLAELPFKLGANMLGRSMGERLVIDPNSNNVLYLGARSGNGLWKSTDYGATWNKVTTMTHVGNYAPSEDDPSSYDSTLTGVVWVTPDPSSSAPGTPCKTIYIGVANKKGQATVYQTLDGGLTWEAVPGQPKNIVVPDSTNPSKTTGLFPHHGVLASNGVLYIPYSDGVGPYDGHKGEVFKYNTKTGVWTDITPIPTSSGDNYFGFGGLAVDPVNPDVLIVSTLNSWWPDANFFRSTDGGATWIRFWDWNGYPERTIRYTQDITDSPWLTFGNNPQPPEPALKLGWMIGNISIDPFNSDRMMYGTGATVYGTNNLTDLENGGKVHLSVYAKGIEQTAVQSLISPTTGSAHLVSGMYDLGGFVHKDLDSVPDMMLRTPFLGNTSIDYAELSPTRYVRVGNTDKGSGSRIGLSYDVGSNWFPLNNPWQSNSEDTTGGGTVAMSADGTSIVWAPNGQSVYYSTNTGSSWSLSAGVPAGAKVASDRVNPSKFYAFHNGSFYVSTNKGATFTATVTNLPYSGHIKAMPGIEGDVWIAGETYNGISGIFHTTDSGQSFTKSTDVEEGYVIGFGKAAPGETYMSLYASAKIYGVKGIFRSDDAGQTWVRINDDAHQYGVTNSCITGDPRIYGRVYLGTNGRGILYADIAGEIPANNASISPTTATFDKKTASQADITVTLALNGNTLNYIKNGSTALVNESDYTVSGNTVTIKKSYLAGLSVGLTALTFDFSQGLDRTLSLTIVDTTAANNADITPVQANFDKNTEKQQDISIALTLNGNTLTAIKNETTVLKMDEDYSLTGTTVVVRKEYLEKLNNGTVNLTFVFSAGASKDLSIQITDTTPVEIGDIQVQFIGTNAASTQGIGAKFRIINTGNTPISLSDVKLRYYYTVDTAASQNFYCDWTNVGMANITGTFEALNPAKATADYYLEIGFTSGAGTLEGGQSVDVHTRFAKSDWSAYTQTNDYSYKATGSSFEDWNKVTAYINGVLSYGIEP